MMQKRNNNKKYKEPNMRGAEKEREGLKIIKKTVFLHGSRPRKTLWIDENSEKREGLERD